MRCTLSLALGMLVLGSSAFVACSSDDDPEPGFTQTGGNGGSPASGAGGAQGGQAGRGGSGGGSSAGRAGAGGGSQGGGAGAGGGGGQGNVCGNDPNEPNNSNFQPTRLVTHDGDNIVSDCDSEQTANALVSGPDDVDWFSFTGQDEGFCNPFSADMQPQARVVSAGSLEVCIFVKPNNGPVQCAGAEEPSDELSVAGYTGCCATGGAKAIITGTTGGGEEDDNGADIYVKVSKLSGASCGVLELKYAFVDP